MTAMLSSRSDLAPLFERRLSRLAEDLWDDFERETDLPFLSFASTRAEKGQATKIMKRTAVNSVRCLGDCNDIVFTLENSLWSRPWAEAPAGNPFCDADRFRLKARLQTMVY